MTKALSIAYATHRDIMCGLSARLESKGEGFGGTPFDYARLALVLTLCAVPSLVDAVTFLPR